MTTMLWVVSGEMLAQLRNACFLSGVSYSDAKDTRISNSPSVLAELRRPQPLGVTS